SSGGRSRGRRAAVSTAERLVELRGVSLAVAGAPVPELEQFSLLVGEGEIVVMLGETGCGSDAVIRIIGGTLARNEFLSGDVVRRGASQSKGQALRIAYLPSPASQPFSPTRSVASQLVRIVARKIGIPRAGAREDLRLALAKIEGAPAWENLEKKPA